MNDLAARLDKLEGYIARFRDSGIANLVGGADTGGQGVFDTRSPTDGSLICTVAEGGAAEVDTAARAAHEAFPAWAAMDGAKRRKLLHRVADLIVARAEEIALCECWDTGQAYRFMSKAALRGAENFRFFADLAPGARDGQTLHSPTLLNLTSRHPIGPVGVITRGTRPSCCPPGRLRRRWPRAARWFTSRPNCLRSPRGSWPRYAKRPAFPRVC